MELKYNHFNKEGAKYLCSNRTFMELKFLTAVGTSINSVVLIVPLWN